MKKFEKSEIPVESNVIDKLYSKFIKRYSLDLTYMDPWVMSDEKKILKRNS